MIFILYSYEIKIITLTRDIYIEDLFSYLKTLLNKNKIYYLLVPSSYKNKFPDSNVDIRYDNLCKF